MLADGGMLLYVTCSIMPMENDELIGRFVSQCDDAELKPIEGLEGLVLQNGIQRLPGVHPGDGFYYALLEKKASAG